MKIFTILAIAAFLLVPVLGAQGKSCKYCETGQGANPRGQGHADCVVKMPAPEGATKFAVMLYRDGKELFEDGDPRVVPVSGKRGMTIFVGCDIMNSADKLIACVEWEGGVTKKTTTLHRRNGKLDRAVSERKLVVPF